MQRDERVFDLDSLVTKQSLPKIRIGGKEVEVHPLNGASLIRLAQLDDDAVKGTDHIRIMYSVAEQLLPSLTQDEVLKMTPEQVAQVCNIAQNKIEQVRKHLEEFEKSDPQ